MFARLLTIFLPVAFGVAALNTISAFALGGPASVVIAQVQAGAATSSPNGDAAATQEFISIFNNASTPVDITNWCVTNKTTSVACFTPPEPHTTLSLAPHAYALIDSDSFETRYAPHADVTFTTTNKVSGSLTGGSDAVSLLDANGTVVDTMGWTSALAGGSVLMRGANADGTLADTDTNADFKKVTSLNILLSGVSEETHVVDECANLDGIQESIPDGYGQLADGSCILDSCPNLSGLQNGMPNGYTLDDTRRCVLIMPRLDITELLPNASGSDEGSEFIELFNPGDSAVDLTNYRLEVGPNLEKTYAFPTGSFVPAGQYEAFTNAGIPFSLLNTSSRVRLVSVDGQVISDVPAYTDPADNEAWAFLDDAWVFTNQPTPGLPNLLPTDDPSPSVTVQSADKACAANQYRNPDTNRCRSIETSPSLAPCKDGQYRSEETNRCRSIAIDATTAKACAEGQFRNPDTGRCKKIASEDEVKDCGEGRERNPASGRCRNIIAAASSTVAGGVRLSPASTASVFGWWAAGIVAFVAAGYAALEWRQEIGGWLARRLAFTAPAIVATRRLTSRLRYNKSHEDNRH